MIRRRAHVVGKLGDVRVAWRFMGANEIGEPVELDLAFGDKLTIETDSRIRINLEPESATEKGGDVRVHVVRLVEPVIPKGTKP